MFWIQVLGINGHKNTNTLRYNIEKVVEELRLDAEIEEVNEVERLIDFSPTGIPALAINGKLIFEMKVPEVEELKRILKPFTQSIKKKLK